MVNSKILWVVTNIFREHTASIQKDLCTHKKLNAHKKILKGNIFQVSGMTYLCLWECNSLSWDQVGATVSDCNDLKQRQEDLEHIKHI